MATPSGERVKEYQLIKKIGKGSYGEVFLVKKRKDRKQFVVKKIRLSASSVKERSAATQEAELLSQLKHPNIVSYHESFHDDEGILHIVMGYCEGGDLCSRLKALKGNMLNEDKVVEWFVQIALALQYLHERMIMHRDLKTQNIFLSKHDVIKVGDLGIARVLEGTLDLAHTVVGTPYYMSPELFANKPYNFKSDVWALGCCVYEIATLNHAFAAKNISALMYKILQGKVPPLPACFSQNLNNLVCKMLSLEAEERPSVYQILRTEFVRYHIKQFLDKATKKRPSKQTPSVCSLDIPEQKRKLPEVSPASKESPILKPLQIREKKHKSTPELSSAREKRRRSKQEASKNRGLGEGEIDKRPSSGKERESQDGGEEEEVLSLMDNTLRLPEPHPPKQPTRNDKGSTHGSVNSKMTEIKRYCINALGEDLVSKALRILDSDADSIEDKIAELLGQDNCIDYFVLLQKIKLYSQTQ